MSTHQEIYLSALLAGKSEHTLGLFNYFIKQYNTVGQIDVVPLKSMIAINNGDRNIAYITQLGKNFVHVVFPFKQAYPDNSCFQKIAQVPGQQQFNHHLRMLNMDDVNEEVLEFMRIAYRGEG